MCAARLGSPGSGHLSNASEWAGLVSPLTSFHCLNFAPSSFSPALPLWVFPLLREPEQENTRAKSGCIQPPPSPRRLCVPVNWGQPASVMVELCGEGEQVNKMSLRTTFAVSVHPVASSRLVFLSHWAKNRFLPANDLHLVPVGKTH